MSSVCIATPVSHLFHDVETARKIIEKSDCLEARERTIDLEFPERKLFHVDIDITHPWNHDRQGYLQECFSKLVELELVTFQATVNCDQPQLRQGMFYSGGDTFSAQEMKQNATLNIEWLRNNLSSGVQIGIENNNYYPTSAYETVTDADFLSEVVNENEINFLLDIAHAFVTAHNRGIDFKEYLKNLPMERCIQLHLCQPVVDANGLAIDAHGLPEGDLLQRSRSLIKDYHIRYLTVEFYKDPIGLIGILEQEREFFHSV